MRGDQDDITSLGQPLTLNHCPEDYHVNADLV